MILRINDRIRNRTVQYFNNFRFTLRYDAIASNFAFSFYFNPDNIEHKELACIGHYHIATIEHNGELLFTGYILSEAFTDAPEKQLVGISGYSLAGVMEDCKIPPEIYPLQFDGLTLSQIVDKLIAPWQKKKPFFKKVIDPSVASAMNSVFNTTTAKENETVKSFICKLASQKDIIVSHTSAGDLLFTKAKTKGQPILNFDRDGNGGIPFNSMGLVFDGQPMHSDITVMKQASADGGNAGQFTIKNPYVPFAYRPETIIQDSGDDNDTQQAARNALAAELKNMKLNINTDRWELNGKIIKPNNTITVINPQVYLYKRSTWFIEQIDFIGESTKMTATLQCVIPEVYNGETPKYLFSGINLH